jgi:hypothetical protein
MSVLRPGKRVALLCSEPLGPRMGGIGIRYLELATHLPWHGLATVLISPGDPDGLADRPPGLVDVRRFEARRLHRQVADCDCVVAQGELANHLLNDGAGVPTVIDLYDPWLVENLYYSETLGHGPYHRDHASWIRQLAGGDFFLCASEEQRLFYSGFLTALGRVNPATTGRDPDLEQLIAVVPFGVAAQLPDHRPFVAPATGARKRILFGGLYDWYDPWTLLAALEQLDGLDWSVLFMRNARAELTPQRLLGEVEARCTRRPEWRQRVEFLDWVPAARRFDLLRDVDVLVSPHRPSLETRLSMRTRFLDALAAGCPVIATAGGTVSRLLVEHGAGWVVPPGDPAALSAALHAVLAGGEAVQERVARGLRLAQELSWERVLAPLVRFCSNPGMDDTKGDFAVELRGKKPAADIGARLRRALKPHDRVRS